MRVKSLNEVSTILSWTDIWRVFSLVWMSTNNPLTSDSASKKSSAESGESLNVSVRLATFTLVNVLKNQALFYQALEVLDLLEQKGEDPDMIRLERDAVKELIKSSEKENKKS